MGTSRSSVACETVLFVRSTRLVHGGWESLRSLLQQHSVSPDEIEFVSNVDRFHVLSDEYRVLRLAIIATPGEVWRDLMRGGRGVPSLEDFGDAFFLSPDERPEKLRILFLEGASRPGYESAGVVWSQIWDRARCITTSAWAIRRELRHGFLLVPPTSGATVTCFRCVTPKPVTSSIPLPDLGLSKKIAQQEQAWASEFGLRLPSVEETLTMPMPSTLFAGGFLEGDAHSWPCYCRIRVRTGVGVVWVLHRIGEEPSLGVEYDLVRRLPAELGAVPSEARVASVVLSPALV